MKLSFTVDGCEALPVRAIPWVAGYEKPTGKVNFPPSLLMQVAHEASHVKDLYGAPLLRLYRIGERGAQPVSIEYLNATAPESDFQPETDEPLRESTRRLPAGVFVFLDELRRCVDWLYPPGCFDGKCQDVIALNTSPDLPDEIIEELREGFVPPRPNAASERSSPRKILFWRAPNEILIPADQVPGAIADALYPRPNRDGAPTLNDPDTVPRLLAEREHAKMLRMKFPHLTDGDKFSIGDLNDYLARLGMVAESRPRNEAPDSIDPESRWQRRQFEDAFNAVREPVDEARRCASALSGERCTELANLHALSLSHWIELVGLGIGRHESYDIGRNGIAFRNWEDDFIAASPIEWQADMERDIEIAPHLKFPCTPAELVEFVDSAIGIHCFSVPEAFRQALVATITSEHNRSDSNTSVGAPEHDALNANEAGPDTPTASFREPDENPKGRKRNPPMRTLIQRFVDDGVAPYIHPIWLHVNCKKGTEGFPVKTVGDSSLTTVEDRQFTKVQVSGALKRWRKKPYKCV